jgi:hypothetical protein
VICGLDIILMNNNTGSILTSLPSSSSSSSSIEKVSATIDDVNAIVFVVIVEGMLVTWRVLGAGKRGVTSGRPILGAFDLLPLLHCLCLMSA